MAKKAEKREKSPYTLKKCEMETSCMIDAESRSWMVHTSDPKFQRKIEKLGYSPVSEIKDWNERSYELPISRIGFRRPVTEAARQKGRAMMSKVQRVGQ